MALTGTCLVKQIRNVRLHRGNGNRGPYHPPFSPPGAGSRQIIGWCSPTPYSPTAVAPCCIIGLPIFDAEQKLDLSIGGFRFWPRTCRSLYQRRLAQVGGKQAFAIHRALTQER